MWQADFALANTIVMNTEQYTKFARDSFFAEKATIERLGMANKG
jgi:hypothetical protein